MKILGMALETNRLQETRQFYAQALMLPVVEEAEESFAVQIGRTKLVFVETDVDHPGDGYFALLIPRQEYNAARDWLERRALLPPVDESHPFANDPNGTYYADPAGNVVGIRPTPLQIEGNRPQLGAFQIVGVGEIGLVVDDPQAAAELLEERLELPVMESDDAFTKVGDAQGVFVLATSQNPLPDESDGERPPVTVTIEGTYNTVDRLGELPYFIHVVKPQTAQIRS